MRSEKIKYFVGGNDICIKPLEPYDDLICLFMDELSKSIREDKRIANFPDVLTFAFWLRKGNISRLKNEFNSSVKRIGRGLVFHIAPSNVPVNFAYSLIFGLLAGNANIVRVSSKNFEQTIIICDAINKVFKQDRFLPIKRQTAVISYERDSEITNYFSSICDARIIWGGDNTINEIKKSAIGTRCIDVVFADRYSLCILDSEHILKQDKESLRKLAEKFYNDTYLMDQNACSSPQMIVWRIKNVFDTKKAKEIFWEALYNVSDKYELSDIKVSQKYEALCKNATELTNIEPAKRYENLLYVITLSKLPQSIDNLRGKFGLFFEYELKNMQELAPLINTKVQTLTYAGVEKEELEEFIFSQNLRGIDRVVPVGEALNIDVVWDGYEIIQQLSRVIQVK